MGKRCIDKVEMVEETEYDEVVQCDHSYDRRCHTTYVTNYESQQEEECEENFRKNCFIDYEKIAFNETVEICRTPFVKDCTVEGPEICTTQYESECWTKQEEHDVEDDVVSCTTVQDEKCADESSGYTTFTKCSKWPERSALLRRRLSRNTLPSLDVPRNPERCVLLLAVDSKKELRFAMTRPALLSRMPPRKNVTLSPRELVLM